MISLKAMALSAAAMAAFATAASASQLSYFSVDFSQLNKSKVSGSAFLTFNDNSNKLKVEMSLMGLEPGGHAAHIHGFTEPNTASISPTKDVFNPRKDGDKDGFTELAEGATFYGGILLTLENLVADANGMANYVMSFALPDGDSLLDATNPLSNREIVVHGLTIPKRAGRGTDGEANGDNPVQEAFLPVAVGNLRVVEAPSPVPLPAAAWMLLAGLGGMGALRMRRNA